MIRWMGGGDGRGDVTKTEEGEGRERGGEGKKLGLYFFAGMRRRREESVIQTILYIE